MNSTVSQRRDLGGMTYEQVRSTFGRPESVDTSYNAKGACFETWRYIGGDFGYGAGRMAVSFINGVVTGVRY